MDPILIVEDSKSFGLSLKKRLQAYFACDVILALSYADAAKQIQETKQPFFMAVLDLILPDAPEGEIVPLIIKNKIPGVVLTGQYQSELRKKILSQGILDYFIKDNFGVIDSVIQFIERIKKNQEIQVLIVDDSRSALTMLKRTLNRYGFSVTKAQDGQHALKQIQENSFQLVLTDYEMPNMDGAQLTTHIRQQYTKNEMVIIGLSSKGSPDLAVQFIKAGANDFLTKPFQVEELFWRVSQNIDILERGHKLDNLVNRLRCTLDNALDAIISVNSHGNVMSYNPAAEKLFGYHKEEVLGHNIADLIVPPDIRPQYHAALDHYHAHNISKFSPLNHRIEMPGLRADGKVIDLEMALTSSMQQGELLFTAFLHDITDRKQLLKSLHETLEVAESANRVKSHFMANMSHEIRTPMNAVIGFTELSLQANCSPVIHNYLKKTKSASHALMGIIDDILDFSKIEAGKLEVDPVEFDLHALFDRLANLFAQQITEKGIELILSIPATINDTFFGDVRRLEQVLINLIRNAIKFTEMGTITVTVELKKQNHNMTTALFSVTDSGIGIEETQLLHLFEPFVQADGSMTRKYGGTGLGLTICKSLVNMMGGDITASSSLGTGSTFIFNLPFQYRATTLKKQPHIPQYLQNIAVLLVDKSEKNQHVVMDILGLFFKTVHAVSSGEAALVELQKAIRTKQVYGLVIINWQLPGMDGIETIAKMVRIHTSASNKIEMPKCIMMTAFGKETLRKQAQEVGVSAFIHKPTTRTQLSNAIMEVFGERNAMTVQPARLLAESTEATQIIGGASILLVEDNVINQEIATALLTKVGLHVSIANNGVEAVKMVYQSSYDAVLMDVQMPYMNGLEATRIIRKQAQFDHLPIIAMTAHVLLSEQKACLQAGMNAHLAKPIRPERLYGALTQWIGPIQQPNTAPAENEEIELPEIAGIEQTHGLQRVAGNHRLYRQLLIRFREEYHHTTKKIDDALKKGDMKAAEYLVHTVRGVASNLGAEGLSRHAEALEQAIKTKNTRQWKRCRNLFSASMIAMLKALESLAPLENPAKITTQPTTQTPGTQDSEPKSINTTKITPLLTELAKLLRQYSLETDPIMQQIKQNVQNTHAMPIFQQLEKHLQAYAFANAMQDLIRLSDLLNIPLTSQP